MPPRVFVKCPSIRKIDGRVVGIELKELLTPRKFLTAPLSKLDDFLRHTWLEYCGHLSAFEFGGEQTVL